MALLSKYSLCLSLVNTHTVGLSILFPPLWQTGVLCVWLYATGFSDSHHRYCLCDNCRDILFVKCRELPLAMDVFLFSCLNISLCVFILNILLLREDKDVRVLPNQLLFWIHFDVFSWTRNSMRWVSYFTVDFHPAYIIGYLIICGINKCFCFYHLNCWLKVFLPMCRSCRFSWFQFVCEKDLQKHQVRLRFSESDRSTSIGLLLETINSWRKPLVMCGEPNNVYR